MNTATADILPVTALLSEFRPISLEEADQVKLMNRKDTKFVVHLSWLPAILQAVSRDYQILTVDGLNMQRYESIYYDSESLESYLAHHNGRLNRTKIRVRTYLETGTTFFEMKMKDNHRRTVKSRIPMSAASEEIPADDATLAGMKWAHGRDSLRPVLKINFSRIMLISTAFGERCTIDIGLEFRDVSGTGRVSMHELCVIEVKRSRDGGVSPMRTILRDLRVQKSAFSKFCIGVIKLFPEVKQNRFKKLIVKLDKARQHSFRSDAPSR